MIRLAISIACVMWTATSAHAQQSVATATPAARESLRDFARCVVRRSPEKTHSVLTRNFMTREYRQELRVLGRSNEDCFRTRGRMRTGGLPLAAALAEAMLLRDPTPLNVRLLRAASTDAPTFSQTDRAAMCVVRSDPDGVAALLQSGFASAAEINAAAGLQVALRRCTPPRFALDLNPYALRSIVATASYRLLETAE